MTVSTAEVEMDEFMAAAVEEAEAGKAEGGIPVGAVLVYGGRVIARGHNRRVQKESVILHAEMDALENAGRLSPVIYRASTLYTTLSPCAMCAGAILLYGIPRVVIGENLSFKGEEELLKSRGVTVEILQDSRCMMLMMSFINDNQELWFEDIGKEAP
jgi:creatinine deaminase